MANKIKLDGTTANSFQIGKNGPILTSNVGTSGQVLSTNGDGTTQWVDQTGGGGGNVFTGDVTINGGSLQIADGIANIHYGVHWGEYGTQGSLRTSNDNDGTGTGHHTDIELRSSYTMNDNSGSAQNSVIIRPPVLDSSLYGSQYTLTLPRSPGQANQLLTTDGTGNLSWTQVTAIEGGNNNRNKFSIEGDSQSGYWSQITINGADADNNLGGGLRVISVGGSLDPLIPFKVEGHTTYIYNLSVPGGSPNQVLSTDGSGNLSWVNQSGGGSVGYEQTFLLMGA